MNVVRKTVELILTRTIRKRIPAISEILTNTDSRCSAQIQEIWAPEMGLHIYESAPKPPLTPDETRNFRCGLWLRKLPLQDLVDLRLMAGGSHHRLVADRLYLGKACGTFLWARNTPKPVLLGARLWERS